MDTLFDRATQEDSPPAPSEVAHTKDPNALTSFFRQYLHLFHARRRQVNAGQNTIQVSEVLSGIAYLYERIRNVVEYKGEHVVRRNAIERILKRLMWERIGYDTKRLAQILIRELIWARYLQNDTVSKHKLDEVGAIITKYLYLLEKLKARGTAASFQSVRAWVWGIASCEIEETLDPSYREPYVLLMHEWFGTYFKWESQNYSEHERETQIYLNIHRALTKSDDQIMRYHLLIREFPQWSAATTETIDEFVEKFARIYEEIEAHLAFAQKNILFRKIQKHVAPFEILRELMRQYPDKFNDLIANRALLEEKVREICGIKYTQIKQKINRGIVRSIVYIFITKIIFAVLIEVPYDYLLHGGILYGPLIINILLPPSLMYLVGLTIRTPGEDNTQRIVSRINSIVYEQSDVRRAVFSLQAVQRNSLLSSIFAVVYMVLFSVLFVGISSLLFALNFTPVGVVIFFAFLSLVLLFGFRVKYTASELNVTAEKNGIIRHLFENLTLPFLNVGVYLSRGLAKINFFTLILDFLIEAPLKTIIEVFEEWTSFIREKREEAVEVPQE